LCRDGLGKDDALDDDAFGFEVGDAVVGAMSHEDGFGEELDEWAGFVGEPAVDGLVVVDDEVVGCVALGADEWGFEGTVKGAAGQFAYGVGAGTNRCDSQGHLFVRLSSELLLPWHRDGVTMPCEFQT
jgi:hypothetical protein